jgi:hypothetical protein
MVREQPRVDRAGTQRRAHQRQRVDERDVQEVEEERHAIVQRDRFGEPAAPTLEQRNRGAGRGAS